MRRPSLRALYVLAVVALAWALTLTGCNTAPSADKQARTADPMPTSASEGDDVSIKTIYLAGGCFWGVEKYMSSVRGVVETEVGYANGVTQSPTYQDVTTGRTGHTETVRVQYDPAVAPLPFLLDLFYEAIDPTSLNRQGNDVGTQYRSGVYYTDPADRPAIERSLARLQERYDQPVVVEAAPLSSFTSAEGYHQDYLDKNPGGYCHIGLDLFEKAAKALPDPADFEAAP